MIIHNKILIVVFSITALISCSNNEFNRYEHFPKNNYLIAEKLYPDTALLRSEKVRKFDLRVTFHIYSCRHSPI